MRYLFLLILNLVLISPLFSQGFTGWGKYLGFNDEWVYVGEELVVNGDFSNFTMDDDANTLGHWIFDDVYHENETGDDITDDQSGNGNDLTANNFSVGFADELTGTNSAYEGGNALKFNGTSEYFSFAGGLGDSVRTIYIRVGFLSSISKSTSGQFLLNMKDSFYGIGIGAITATYSNEIIALISNTRRDAYTSEGSIAAGNYFIAFAYDATDQYDIYLNNSQVDNAHVTEASPIFSNVLNIARRSNNDLYYSHVISEIAIFNAIKTVQEIKESYGLAKYWRTSSGAITPTNVNFAQRFTNSASVTDLMQQTVSVEVGKRYRLQWESYRVSGSGSFVLNLSGAHAVTLTKSNTSNQSHIYDFVAATTSLVIKIYGTNAAGLFQVDNVSIKEIELR